MNATTSELPDTELLAPHLEALVNLRRDIQAPASALRDLAALIGSIVAAVGLIVAVQGVHPSASSFATLVGALSITAAWKEISDRRTQRRWEMVLTILSHRAKT